VSFHPSMNRKEKKLFLLRVGKEKGDSSRKKKPPSPGGNRRLSREKLPFLPGRALDREEEGPGRGHEETSSYKGEGEGSSKRVSIIRPSTKKRRLSSRKRHFQKIERSSKGGPVRCAIKNVWQNTTKFHTPPRRKRILLL